MPQVPGTVIKEGAAIDVEFVLPDSGSIIQARGLVRWIDDNIAGETERVACGLRFTEMDSAGRVALARYVAEYRPHFSVVLASAE